MDFDKLIKKRASIRRYSMKKVSASDLTAVCEAARFIPVAGNIYTIRLIVVSDKESKEKIAEACLGQEFVREASFLIVVCSDLSLLKRSYGSRAEIYGKQHAGAAIQNMLLKITDLELASCWIGAFDENAIKRILKIPEDIQVEAVLTLANPISEEKPKKKPDLKHIIYFEKYGQKTANLEKKPYV